jgi:hypothetical protein
MTMPRPLVIVLSLPLTLLAGAVPVGAEGSPGPGRPVWPAPGETDNLLYDKAMRIQSGMWWHLSPEGVLVERHAVRAGPERLSHDALQMSDIAIWTGFYAASQACRWHVTRDPDARRQVRHLARGLALLTEVTGVEGCLARNVGRPLPGQGGHLIEASPSHPGLHFRGDASRDQLAGVVLGWALIHYYMKQDPDLLDLAAAQMRALARRLYAGGMTIRDPRGRPTEHGELRTNRGDGPLALIPDGGSAAIGFATLVIAWDLNPSDPHLAAFVQDLDRRRWDEALEDQGTFLPTVLRPTNVNMVLASLLAICMAPRDMFGTKARRGMSRLRKATRGWWNAGFCGMAVLAGVIDGFVETLGELRATLHAMPELERSPWALTFYDAGRIVPIHERFVHTGWAWKEDVTRAVQVHRDAPNDDAMTWTRADWLFAYWLARARGFLRPRVGPGAEPTAHACPVASPPWLAEEDPGDR